MDIVSQFSAVRELHALIKSQGESPELLGALVRAYANLGVLTEHFWLPDHKVFKARALLYAERLMRRQSGKPWGMWHKAYAEALVGLHCSALADLESAAKKENPLPPA